MTQMLNKTISCLVIIVVVTAGNVLLAGEGRIPIFEPTIITQPGQYVVTRDITIVPDGGVSGSVLRERSFSLLTSLAAELFPQTLLVSVGGIDSGEEAYRRLKAGASLVQIYSALVFRGPGLAAEINRSLIELMERDGVTELNQVIGTECPPVTSQEMR